MKQKKLKLYQRGKLVQTVTFQKNGDSWRATHFNRDAYMPFAVHDQPKVMRQKLESQSYKWEWV